MGRAGHSDCSAAQPNAALLDRESSSPTTISVPHPAPPRRRAASFTSPTMAAPSTRTTALGRPWRGPSSLAPTASSYAYVLLGGEQQSGLPTDVCVTLGSSTLPHHPVG